MSFTNGHPTRKFRNIRPVKIDVDEFAELNDEYCFQGLKVKVLNMLFPKILERIADNVKNMREKEGFTEEEMCDIALNYSSDSAEKIHSLHLANKSMKEEEKTEEWKKTLYRASIEFAHNVTLCAYLGACAWGDDFGIVRADGTMPLVPEDEIGNICRKIAGIAKKHTEKKSAEPKKFTDLFTPESIKAGDVWFAEHYVERSKVCCHTLLETYNHIFHDCKKWATGEKTVDGNINFTFNKEKCGEERFKEIMLEYYNKARVFLFILSIHNKGQNEEEGLQYFLEKLAEAQVNIISQVLTKDRIGFIGIYTDEEYEAFVTQSPNAKVMALGKKAPKMPHLCRCGCGTYKMKMKKSEGCGARYVDAEHQKKDWVEHKKKCDVCALRKSKINRPEFKMPTNLAEELAMWVCPPSCEGCLFCEYTPQFVSVELD